MHILIVEDDLELASSLKSMMEAAIGIADTFDTILDAKSALSTYKFDLVIIDRHLLDGDGLSLLPTLRQLRPRPATLILTAQDDPADIVAALDKGADEYVCKPFEPMELIARARAVLRRYSLDETGCTQYGNLSFDLTNRSAMVDGHTMSTPRRELAILEALIRRAGRVVQRDNLESSVYSMDSEIGSNAIDSHVSKLRKRLRESGSNVTVRTIRGIGYMLVQE